ncbi:TPA: 2-isopropylmalate synthase, partial [Staphylococcus aureus]|nr:2-isopropylmalate synthase [Staphylococcus aureus]
RIEGTVNGIGERAGNAALEEVALALYVRNDYYGAQTALNLEETKKTSDLISRYAGIRVPRNKAIVGQNAFSHESGIHQDGVLKHRETYEIMTPQLVGVSTTELPLGKLSGKHAFSEKLKALGYDIDKEAQIDLFKQFKAIADKKKSVSDRDIHAIIQGSEHEHQALYKLETLQLQYVSSGLQSAVVVVKDKEDHIYQDSSIGTGSIVAIYNAVDRIFQKETELIDYRINSVTEGTDAQAEVHVNLLIEGKTVNGFGIDHDILQASCKAYVEAHAKFAAENVEKVGN